MRHLSIIIAVTMAALLCGCSLMHASGGGGSGASAPAAPGPFADIAGSYQATVHDNGGPPAATNPVGTIVDFTVSDSGVLTGNHVYHIVRMPDGSFTTNIITLSDGTTQYITANQAMTSATAFTLAPDGTHGFITYTVIKLSAAG